MQARYAAGTMIDEKQETPASPSIRDLYPQLSDEDLRNAEERFDRYIALVLRIYERLCSDPDAYQRFEDLTHPREDDV